MGQVQIKGVATCDEGNNIMVDSFYKKKQYFFFDQEKNSIMSDYKQIFVYINSTI